mgnify:CR=1 FL=1|jgi:hypothetical protein
MKERIPSFTRNPDKKQITIKGRSLRWRDLPSFYAQGCVRKLVDLLHAPRATSREDESSLLDFIRSAILLEQFVKYNLKASGLAGDCQFEGNGQGILSLRIRPGNHIYHMPRIF